jgi:hypothetical protein
MANANDATRGTIAAGIGRNNGNTPVNPWPNDPSLNSKNGFRIAGKSLAILNPFPQARFTAGKPVTILRTDTISPAGSGQ